MVTKHRMAVNKDSMLYMIESRLSKKPAITQHRAQNIERTIGVSVTDETGKLVLFDGLMIDITEHKQMEETLQKSEEFSSKLLSDSSNPVVVIDSDGLIRGVPNFYTSIPPYFEFVNLTLCRSSADKNSRLISTPSFSALL